MIYLLYYTASPHRTDRVVLCWLHKNECVGYIRLYTKTFFLFTVVQKSLAFFNAHVRPLSYASAIRPRADRLTAVIARFLTRNFRPLPGASYVFFYLFRLKDHPQGAVHELSLT